jgi:hypothetical protein
MQITVDLGAKSTRVSLPVKGMGMGVTTSVAGFKKCDRLRHVDQRPATRRKIEPTCTAVHCDTASIEAFTDILANGPVVPLAPRVNDAATTLPVIPQSGNGTE